RLLSTNAFQHRVGTDSIGKLLDSIDALVPTLGHNLGRAEFAGQFLPLLVTAHRDDALGTHLFRGKNSEQADCTVTNYSNSRARFHVRCIGGKPASTHNVREREQTRNQIVRRHSRRGDKSAVGHRDPNQWCLRGANQLALLTRRLVSDLTVGTSVVGGKERTDDELTWFDGPHCASNFFYDAAVFVPHRSWLWNRVDAAIRPQVRSTHACSGRPNDRIRRLDDLWDLSFFKSHIMRSV